MASISLRSLTKRFGPVVAVDNLNLDMQEGELIALLGPSGCGKTTTLRMIAGFEIADEGSVNLAGRDVTALPPEKRNAGMVFQNYALFPHLTVYRNVAYGLETRKVPKAEIKERVSAILDKVQLTGLGDRYPRQLSGGQQQRTALARALVINPSVLLLDEPLANLDAKLREEMRFYIRSLQQEVGITTVYVTHDQAEALVMADRVAVMSNGLLQQLGVPSDIYRRPCNAWVADFVGLTNLIPGTVAGNDGKRIRVKTELGLLRGTAGEVLDSGTPVLVSIRPESLNLSKADHTSAGSGRDENLLNGTIRESAYLGNLIDYRIDVGREKTLRVQSSPVPAYAPGAQVTVTFADEETWIVRDERGEPDGNGRDRHSDA